MEPSGRLCTLMSRSESQPAGQPCLATKTQALGSLDHCQISLKLDLTISRCNAMEPFSHSGLIVLVSCCYLVVLSQVGREEQMVIRPGKESSMERGRATASQRSLSSKGRARERQVQLRLPSSAEATSMRKRERKMALVCSLVRS